MYKMVCTRCVQNVFSTSIMYVFKMGKKLVSGVRSVLTFFCCVLLTNMQCTFVCQTNEFLPEKW